MRANRTVAISSVTIGILILLAMLAPINMSRDIIKITNGTPSGWTDDIRLTFAPSISVDPDITTYGSCIYVVWGDYRGPSYEIYFKKSEDDGLTWSQDFQISTYPVGFGHPRIAVNGSQIHVVWEGLDLTREVHYRNSTDGGGTWNPVVRLTENDGDQSYIPDICVVGDNIHVVWDDKRDYPEPELYYRNSTDGGATWNTPQRLTYYADADGSASIQANGSKVHITWARWLTKNEVFYMDSNDGGITWNPEQQLTPNDGGETFPYSIAVWHDNVHILYRDAIEGSPEVYYMNSTDGGGSWSNSKRISDLGDHSYSPDIIVNGDDVYVVWMDDRDYYGYVGDPWGPCEVYFSNSTDGGITWSSNLRLTYAKNQSTYPEIALSNNGNIHIVWQDNRTGNNQDYEIYYKRSPDFPPDPTYNISLDEGWNLISLPHEQRDESITEVLSSINGKWDYLQAYDPLSPEPWKTYATFKPGQLNDLQSLNHRMGFWINVTEPNVTLTVSGPIPASTSINLYAGWNLVGYPSLTNETVANALWGTGADKVEVFDLAEPYRIREVGPSYVMKPGEGYWVHVPADTTWIINW